MKEKKVLYKYEAKEENVKKPEFRVLSLEEEDNQTTENGGDRWFRLTVQAENESPVEIIIEYRKPTKNIAMRKNIGIWVEHYLVTKVGGE